MYLYVITLLGNKFVYIVFLNVNYLYVIEYVEVCQNTLEIDLANEPWVNGLSGRTNSARTNLGRTNPIPFAKTILILNTDLNRYTMYCFHFGCDDNHDVNLKEKMQKLKVCLFVLTFLLTKY